jgi:hypothetical protein
VDESSLGSVSEGAFELDSGEPDPAADGAEPAVADLFAQNPDFVDFANIRWLGNREVYEFMPGAVDCLGDIGRYRKLGTQQRMGLTAMVCHCQVHSDRHPRISRPHVWCLIARIAASSSRQKAFGMRGTWRA